ncbi:MAG: putative quinol monooxygenase [Planctomycetota bacterium]
MKTQLPLIAAAVALLLPLQGLAEEPLHPIAADVSLKLDDPERPFVMLVQLKVPAGQGDALVEAMKVPTRETAKEPGNFAYQLSQDTERPDHYVLYEVWENVAALDSHLRQPYLNDLLAAFEKVLAEPPKVTVLKPVTFDD